MNMGAIVFAVAALLCVPLSYRVLKEKFSEKKKIVSLVSFLCCIVSLVLRFIEYKNMTATGVADEKSLVVAIFTALLTAMVNFVYIFMKQEE